MLLDYYIRRKFVHPDILQSVKDKPPPDYMEEKSWSSVLNSISNNRSFQVEASMRLSLCLALAIGTYMHDQNKPKRLEMQREEEMLNMHNLDHSHDIDYVIQYLHYQADKL